MAFQNHSECLSTFQKFKGGVMDIQKEKHNYLAMLVAEDAITQEQCSNLSLYNGGNYFHSDFLASSKVDCINWGWSAWQAAKAQAVPEVINVGNELQSWVAVWSFKARHDREDYIVVDANLLADKIEKLTGANA